MGLKEHGGTSSSNNMLHKRSRSFHEKRELPENKLDHTHKTSDCSKMDMKHLNRSSIKTKPLSNAEVLNLLRQEILQLQKILQNEVAIRGVLEKALGNGSISHDIGNEVLNSQPVTELIEEISALELEVGHLEQYILLLYRQAFDQQKTSSNIVSLAKHLGTRISDHAPKMPNKLSEDMIQCISDIYCKLADPLSNQGLSSPTSSSSSSSVSEIFPKDHSGRSLGLEKYSSPDKRLDNLFHVQGHKEFSGPCSTMFTVQYLCRDEKKLAEVKPLLQNFRFLISRLEEIDPKKMTHPEKLAFWINVHNALMMHAHLANGIPQNNGKRLLVLLKAAYNVGGHIVSANLIQSIILRCRMSLPGQWLRLLLNSESEFKPGDERQAYSIEHAEPLLHFALCSGSHSDPAVRVYTPNKVVQELEAAKDEYIRATVRLSKGHRILLPKLVESFAKASDIFPTDGVEMIEKSLPQSVRRSIKKCPRSNFKKIVKWVPYDFSFQYLILKEL